MVARARFELQKKTSISIQILVLSQSPFHIAHRVFFAFMPQTIFFFDYQKRLHCAMRISVTVTVTTLTWI